MKIVCCQLDIVWENKPANYKKVRALLDAAAIPAGALVVLPEMFATGFSMNVAGIREGTPSETESFLATAARDYKAFMLGGLVTVGADGRGRNQSVVFSPDGKLLCRYSKMHPFTLGGESKHYAAGTEIMTFDWQGFLVAPFICYDLRFPEIFRLAARRGAQLFTVIADWPVKRADHWVTLLQARAIENLAYVVGVNRSGNDPFHPYPGRSLIIDPHGKIIADAGDEERVISTDVEVTEVTSWRSQFPALQDIHSDLVKG